MLLRMYQWYTFQGVVSPEQHSSSSYLPALIVSRRLKLRHQQRTCQCSIVYSRCPRLWTLFPRTRPSVLRINNNNSIMLFDEIGCHLRCKEGYKTMNTLHPLIPKTEIILNQVIIKHTIASEARDPCECRNSFA